jgi:hypothetical protein
MPEKKKKLGLFYDVESNIKYALFQQKIDVKAILG